MIKDIRFEKVAMPDFMATGFRFLITYKDDDGNDKAAYLAALQGCSNEKFVKGLRSLADEIEIGGDYRLGTVIQWIGH